jgi:hypothetical protein
VDSIVAFAFERYYRTASLIGAPQTCLPMIERLKSIGVNEVACLIDFGVDVESTLEGLVHLNTLKQLCQTIPTTDGKATPESELASFLQQKLPSSLVPKSLIVVNNLPKPGEEPLQVQAMSQR